MIGASEEGIGRSISRQKEVVITDNATFAYKQAASSHERIVPINPDTESLARFSAAKCDEHCFYDPSPLSRAEQQKPKEYFRPMG